VTSTFHLTEDAETLSVWPHKFELIVTLVLKTTSLSQQLSVINRDEHPFDFTALLHTYFRTDNINNTQVCGLKDLTYLDKPNNAAVVVETNDPVVFRGEVDRVYQDGGSRTIYISDGGNAEFVLKTTGFKDLVVWNPAAEKAKTMADLGEESFTHFVCVEAGSVVKPVTLQAGNTWEGAQGLSIRLKESK